VEYRSFLAPIHEYTDLPFRMLCRKYGAEAACVPLVSAAALAHDESKISLVDAHPDERNIGVQVFGPDEPVVGKAAGVIAKALPFVSYLELNCGCPSSRTMESGSGSAMLERPGVIARCVSTMKRSSGLPVSVKLRVKGGPDETLAICRRIEDAGADFITIHARTPGQGYSGKADWEVAEGVSIPVVGNGDITTAYEGRSRVEQGYCSAFMVGRAAMANPMLFCDRGPQSVQARFALLGEYVELQRKYLGETRLRDIRLKGINFMSGIRGAASLRNRISLARDYEAIMALRDGPGP
jgi:tRNA-dihydrouridine synthase B